MVAAAVGDRSHRFPHRHVLRRDALDAGEVAALHGGAILHVAVLQRALLAVILVDVDADGRRAELAPRFLADALLRIGMPGDPVEHGVNVVDRHQHLRQVVLVVRRDQHRERRDEECRAHILVCFRIFDRLAQRRVAEPVGRRLELQARRLVVRWARPRSLRRLGAVHLGRWHVGGVQARAVRRVDRAFEHLRPVARRVHLHDRVADAGLRRPGRRLELPHLVLRPEPCPDETGGFAH